MLCISTSECMFAHAFAWSKRIKNIPKLVKNHIFHHVHERHTKKNEEKSLLGSVEIHNKYDSLPVPDLSPVQVHDPVQSSLVPCLDVRSDPVSGCAIFVAEIEMTILDPSNRADGHMML